MKNKTTHTHTHTSRQYSNVRLQGLFTFLVLNGLCFLLIGNAFAQSESPILIEDGSKHCPYSDVVFTTSAVNPGTKYWRVEYAWTFQDGDPQTHVGIEYSNPSYPSPGPRNPGPVTWDEEGTFTISLTISVFNALVGGTMISQFTYQADVTIDATCCGNELLPIPTLTGTQTVLSGIYFMESDLTIPNGHRLIITGTVLVAGEAIPNIGPGGTVTASFFRVEQGGAFEMSGGEVRAHCESMWGGVESEQDSKVELVNSDFKDSFFGIHPNSGNSGAYQISVGDSRFFNNRQCITAEDIDGTTGDNYIVGSTFDCDPETFLTPFEYNTGHNTGESFRMEYGVKLEGDIEFTASYFSENNFNNGLIGIQIINNTPASLGSTDLVFEDNNFNNNQIVGLYINKGSTVDLTGVSTFNIPTSIDATNYQYSEFVLNNVLDIPENTIFGLVSLETQRLFVRNSLFDATQLNFDPNFVEDFDRIGIYASAEEWSCCGTDIDAFDSRFISLTKGVELRGLVDHMYFERNDFEDNKYALFIDAPSPAVPSPKGNFFCNSFVKTSETEDILTYGIYITDGTQMDDFGGTTFQSPPPCGNGWPVDENNSPGYPSTAEDLITGLLDIYQWTPPALWYSIYDENATSETDVMGYTYHAFDNEHVGDFEDVVDWSDDAVWPTSIIWRRNDNQNPLRGDENTCTTQPEIPFPSARTVAQIVNSLKEQGLTIHPNPFSDELMISVQNSSLNIERIQILDLSGKVMLSTEEHFYGETIRINTSQLKSGVYMLQAISETSELSVIKLIKQ